MIYIYDILLNFNKYIYEYYEWNKSDNIEHIKRIRLFKVETDIMDCFFKYNIRVDREFLDIIFNKTDTYKKTVLEYCSLFTDGIRTLAIKFDKEGNSLLKSRLTLEEEEEVLDVSKKLDWFAIKFDKFDYNGRELLTRSDENIKYNLSKYFDDLYNGKNKSILSFLYLDYFDTFEVLDLYEMYNNLKDSLTNINDKHREMLTMLNKIKDNINIKTSL